VNYLFQKILTEQLSLYSEWIEMINEARHWFEEGKKAFIVVNRTLVGVNDFSFLSLDL
jgi:hypothetical protein